MRRKLYGIFFITLISTIGISGQVFNTEVQASIVVEQNSEFYTFKARAENLTPIDRSLRYDFMMFKQDVNGNQSKSNQENRFYLNGNQIVILSETVVNYNVEAKIILVLLIYDQYDKPIGMQRLELPKGGKTPISKMLDDSSKDKVSIDEAQPQDGFVLGGFVFNKSITKAGNDFYRMFFNDYNNRNIKTKKNITIKEVPGRGRTTRISVYVENRLVWQFFSQIRKEFLKQMTQQSIRRVIMELQRLERQNKEFENWKKAKLENEEISQTI